MYRRNQHNLPAVIAEMKSLTWDYEGMFEFFRDGKRCNSSYGGRNGTWNTFAQARREVSFNHDCDSVILHFIDVGGTLTHDPDFILV